MARGRAGCQDFLGELEVDERFDLERRLMEVEREVDRAVAEEMGVRERDLAGIVLPAQTVYEAGVRRGLGEVEIRRGMETGLRKREAVSR